MPDLSHLSQNWNGEITLGLMVLSGVFWVGAGTVLAFAIRCRKDSALWRWTFLIVTMCIFLADRVRFRQKPAWLEPYLDSGEDTAFVAATTWLAAAAGVIWVVGLVVDWIRLLRANRRVRQLHPKIETVSGRGS